MWDKIKKLFIKEIPKIDDVTYDPKVSSLLSDLEWLISTPGIDRLLSNEVIKIYILKVWFTNASQLFIRDNGEFISKRSLVYVGDYFDGLRNNIYYFLKQMHFKTKNGTLSKKQMEDVRCIIEMFKFYIGE